MRLNRRAASITLAGALVLGGSAALAATAHATGLDNWCNNTSGQECLDAWFGGPLIKTYPYGPPNQNNTFYVVQEGQGPCGGYQTSPNCPWSGAPGGLPIVNLESAADGGFIGDYQNSSSDARSGTVGFSGWGWNWIEDKGACGPNSALFISIHWSNSWYNAHGLQLASSTGAQVYNNSTELCLVNM
jgi:hypothetical protein